MIIEEKLILTELKNRNQKVFKKLFCEYYPLLVRYAEGFIFDSESCDDVVQNVFIRFWENIQDINIETSIKSYLYASVRNRCLNYLRDLNIRDKHNMLYMENFLRNEEKSDWIDPEMAEKISLTVEKLPPQMATLFKMKYIYGKKYAEIAEMFNISENTVKTHIQRAKIKLRSYLVP